MQSTISQDKKVLNYMLGLGLIPTIISLIILSPIIIVMLLIIRKRKRSGK